MLFFGRSEKKWCVVGVEANAGLVKTAKDHGYDAMSIAEFEDLKKFI